MKPFSFRVYFRRLWRSLKEGSISSGVLRGLIIEVESTSGYERNDVRAKAKLWLISHEPFLAANDILLAKTHFGYLLPEEWGT